MIRKQTIYRITTLVILIVVAGTVFCPWQNSLSSFEKRTPQNIPDNQSITVANDPKPSTLSILTWNLEWFFDHDQADNVSDLSKKLSAPSSADWEWKLQVVAETISKIKPSIMGLQEVENRRVLDELVRHLKEKYGLSYRIAFIEGFDKATEQEVGILYRNGLVEFSRFEQSGPMFRSNQFYNLSKHIVARFRWGDGENTEELIVVNVHLRARSEEAELRQRQCKLLRYWLQDLRRHSANVIILGDLNTDELADNINLGSDIHGLLAGPTDSPEDDLHDLLNKAPQAERQTHLLLNKQFDRILASQSLMKDRPGSNLVFENIKVLSELNIRGAGVDPGKDHWESYWQIDPQERDISDHHPVVAEFSFNR